MDAYVWGGFPCFRCSDFFLPVSLRERFHFHNCGNLHERTTVIKGGIRWLFKTHPGQRVNKYIPTRGENLNSFASSDHSVRLVLASIVRQTRYAKMCYFLFVLSLAVHGNALAQTKRIYIANDDHTDYVWIANESAYRTAFLGMLDYYLNQADSTANDPSDFQGRFTADGNFWLWTYQHNRSASEFQRLMDRVKDGHINVSLETLVMVYGGMPAEAVIRNMYYPGRLERQFGVRFEVVTAMENQTFPFGLPSLWAGAGARYSWKGVCGCATQVSGLYDRGREIYHAVGPDGRSILMKWHSFNTSQSSGGYAEAYDPSAAVNFASADQGFLSRYPYPPVVGMFGKGWDGLSTFTTEFLTTARAMSNASRRVVVSNEADFFHDFESSAPPGVVPAFSAGFGNEWDMYIASMAEVTAGVKRSVESLRTAEALATLVSLALPDFMSAYAASADSAFVNLGLYYEHDWTMDGPASSGRPAFQRRTAAQIGGYVSRLRQNAATALGQLIQSPPGVSRFYVFNPLSWTRTDVADLPFSASGPVRVIDVTTSAEVRSQMVLREGQSLLRILAENVPPAGYRIYEVQQATTAFTDSAASFSNGNSTFENAHFRVSVNGRGAITSLVDKTDGDREWGKTTGGRQLNDIGSGAGTPVPENVGPVSATLFIDAGGSPSHRSRVTLYGGIDRVDIDNEVTAGFGNNTVTYGFGFNLTGATTRHEEVGAIATAKLASQGGSYADQNGRYDYLTMNHFVDLSDAQRGITLSNWDSPFFKLGGSSGGTLDASSSLISALVGARIDGLGASSQGGDTYFRNRYALWPHASYDQSASMRTALGHQNPFQTGIVTGSSSSPYPPGSFSPISLSDSNVVVWALKPSEEGIGRGVIARLWNVSQKPVAIQITLNGVTLSTAQRTTHIETDIGDIPVAGSSIADTLPAQWMQTYRLGVQLLPASVGEEHSRAPEKFLLRQNYPNPFNPTTTIRWEMAEGGWVSLRVYDLLGQDVAALVNERKAPGSYAVAFDATDLPTGVYFYRLSVNGFTSTRKLALLR